MQHRVFWTLQRCLSLKKVLLTSSIPLQNKWWGIEYGKKYDQLTMNMHIQTARFESKSLFMGENVHVFSSHLLIPNPIQGKRMEVSIIVYFVKFDQIKLEWTEWILCISMLVFQKWCPGFKSPSLKWAHHKTNTFWQQAGSLCSYEAQNLMSMNNEYYSTCWWLSRLPVIRSMKALFSREHSLSDWMMDSQPSVDPTHWK